jgi:MFS family permease
MGHEPQERRWYAGITRYQWLVLVIASLGWIFDIFEGQIFVASMNESMKELLPPATSEGDRSLYNNIIFAAFLLGGAIGGVLFGALSDRIGRVRTMVYTILVYSLFTCLSAWAQTWWHMALFRFLVALGVGGEWAVAASLVAEVFPQRARARSLAIFHASSVLGTLMAVAAGAFIVGNPAFGWRWGFALGAVPAVLVVWILTTLHEPVSTAPRLARRGGVTPLFRGKLLRHILVGVGLAAVGLATFWGTHIYGKDVLRRAAATSLRSQISETEWHDRAAEMEPRLKDWEMLGMLLVTVGGGFGLLSFGPLAERFGRRGAFLAFHAGGWASAVLLFQVLSGIAPLLLFLPIFGFLTLGMHAGYAVYFPELFPTALRGSGTGFCFNFGRILAAPILFLSGWLQRPTGRDLSLENAATLLSFLFLVGIALLLFAPETRGQELPE